MELRDYVTMFPTPTATERSGTNPKTGRGAGLWKTVKMFPTPDTQNHRDGAKLRKDNNLKEGGMHGVSLHHYIAMFPTPTKIGRAHV